MAARISPGLCNVECALSGDADGEKIRVYSPNGRLNHKEGTPMRELNFSKGRVAEAFEEIHENFEDDVEREVEGNTTEFLNGMLRVEASRQVGADLYERTLRRIDYFAGCRPRTLVMTKGTYNLSVPKARSTPLRFTLFDRYQRLWKRVDAMLREIFLAGCSTRRTGEVLELLLGTRVSAQTVSRAVQELTPLVESFHERQLEDRYRVLLLDGVTQKLHSGTGRAKKKVMLVAYGITHTGCRELIDFMLSPSESENAWFGFLNRLYHRGLEGETLELIVSDGGSGLVNALTYVYAAVKHQRCWAHKLRNIADKVNKADEKRVLAGVKKIYLAPHRKAALRAFRCWRDRWINQYPQAVRCLERDLDTLLTFFDFPTEMREHIRTTNFIERSFKEVRRRTRSISCFANADSCERIMYAIFVYLNSKWESDPINECAHNS
jgi:putative transposase